MPLPPKITGIPFYWINSSSVLPLSTIRLSESVTLRLLNDEQSLEIHNIRERSPRPPSFYCNSIIEIKQEAYNKKVTRELIAEGRDMNFLKDGDDKERFHRKHWLYLEYDVARHVIITLCILRKCLIKLPGDTIDYRRLPNGKLRRTGLGVRSGPEEISYHISHEKITTDNSFVTTTSLRTMYRHTYPYYKAVYWQHDRISFALGCLWASQFSRYTEQSFMSMSMIFETLLGQEKNEISHQIAERTAVVLGKNGAERHKIYEDIRRLYNSRSKIIHGESYIKRGTIMHTEQSFISARSFNVSTYEFAPFYDYCRRLINKFLTDTTIRAIMSNKNRDKELKDFRNFYMSRLLAS